MWKSAPNLSYERDAHCSLCLGDCAYVFAGSKNSHTGSIESLDVNHCHGWKICVAPCYPVQTRFPAVVAVNQSTIAVLGGDKSSKGYIFDTRTANYERIMGTHKDLAFNCNTHTLEVEQGKYITVGIGKDEHVHMIEFKLGDDSQFQARSIRDFGNYY